ncbi:hypothetical protein AMTR_s00007p00265470 [Amborella trichopoda]|uniref:Uncharacterized protein n=1 Tax=Amborella trichopoda TaxID=13333 RepID=W1PCW3_AMBTC|nr:hypothetical protein AMTR_s00007p00265470 [Amborella trichopoda]
MANIAVSSGGRKSADKPRDPNQTNGRHMCKKRRRGALRTKEGRRDCRDQPKERRFPTWGARQDDTAIDQRPRRS